jgi:hypothetical protein
LPPRTYLKQQMSNAKSGLKRSIFQCFNMNELACLNNRHFYTLETANER